MVLRAERAGGGDEGKAHEAALVGRIILDVAAGERLPDDRRAGDDHVEIAGLRRLTSLVVPGKVHGTVRAVEDERRCESAERREGVGVLAASVNQLMGSPTKPKYWLSCPVGPEDFGTAVPSGSATVAEAVEARSNKESEPARNEGLRIMVHA